MRIVVPIIKLKAEQFKAEAMNLSFKDKTSKLHKIIQVLEAKMKESDPSLNDINLEIKGLLLKHRLEKKMLSIILDTV